uniref:Uncharacterized protein n=1 Tax=Zea mays TaxID=4577 RepID=B6U8C2_MAIZE|nr:hypothetical protein [Zea mays]
MALSSEIRFGHQIPLSHCDTDSYEEEEEEEEEDEEEFEGEEEEEMDEVTVSSPLLLPAMMTPTTTLSDLICFPFV